MKYNFQVTSLPSEKFQHLFQYSDTELAQLGAIRMVADSHPGYPCRVSLEDAKIGEEVLLFPYQHHDVTSPYQAAGPVFIRKNAQKAQLPLNTLPKMLHHRLLSIRAYDQQAMMIDARTIEGKHLEEIIESIFEKDAVRYLQVHNANPGCFNCQIDRVE